MTWIAQNLWLIPALPLLAAGLALVAPLAGAERRQKVAHGASRGAGKTKYSTSPGGE